VQARDNPGLSVGSAPAAAPAATLVAAPALFAPLTTTATVTSIFERPAAPLGWRLLRAGLSLLLLAGASVAQPQDNSCSLIEQAVLERVNAVRAVGSRCGRDSSHLQGGALQWNERLREMALMQAQFLTDVDDLRHAGPNGQTITDRARASGYAYQRVAENLALGAQSVDHVLRAWTASQSHCVNLYSATYTEVALVCQANRRGKPLWVMVLGRPKP
jgi:uncharacterized protein YkwD